MDGKLSHNQGEATFEMKVVLCRNKNLFAVIEEDVKKDLKKLEDIITEAGKIATKSLVEQLSGIHLDDDKVTKGDCDADYEETNEDDLLGETHNQSPDDTVAITEATNCADIAGHDGGFVDKE
jgi:hypothetical protein